MRGFQLWINLPAKEKMQPARYQDVQPEEIPNHALADGGSLKVIAGTTDIDGKKITGPIQDISTQALIMDVELPAGGLFRHAIPTALNAFVYLYEGHIQMGSDQQMRALQPQAAGVLSAGDEIHIRAGDEPAAFLLLAARPLGEPIAQYGPFVMNTHEEIEQAMADYRNGELV